MKSKTISLGYLCLGAFLGIIFWLTSITQNTMDVKAEVFSLLPGIVFLVLAKVTKEQIGAGDGWIMLILGMCTENGTIWLLWQTALLVSAIFSVLMMLMRKISKKSQLPFLPFLWVSYILLWGMKYV